jgi:hypothetical protein
LEKTGKGLITHTCANTLGLYPFLHFDHGNDGISGVEVGVKWRPEASELAEFGPEFEEVWDSHYANAPDKPVLWMGIVSRCVLRFYSR